MTNPLLEIQKFGQSAWLDYIHRDDLENGDLQRRIDEEGVLGVTSNPSIFQKAIGDSDTYDAAIMTMLDLEAQGHLRGAGDWKTSKNATDLFPPHLRTRRTAGDGLTSAWRCRPCWRAIPRARSTKPSGSSRTVGRAPTS